MILELLGVLALGVSWESWSRYLKHKERVEGIRRSRENELLKELEHLRELLQQSLEEAGATPDRNRVIMKTFLESIMDIVNISEGDKQNLKNRFEAAKLGKKL